MMCEHFFQVCENHNLQQIIQDSRIQGTNIKFLILKLLTENNNNSKEQRKMYMYEKTSF